MCACVHAQVLEVVQEATEESEDAGPAPGQTELLSPFLEDAQGGGARVSAPAAVVGLWPWELFCPQHLGRLGV